MKKEQTTLIDVGSIDNRRPQERAPKSNLKLELLKTGVKALQHVAPYTASRLVWQQFTKPGATQFTKSQEVLMGRAEIGHMRYDGYDLVTYRWGSGPKVLLAHGWNSKVADFRMLIERLVDYGFSVEGVDWKGHGQSPGTHTALPEIRDVIKSYYVQHGPFEAVVGYSIGGLATGIALSEVSQQLLPQQLFLFAAPPYPSYFFKDAIQSIGLNNKVYQNMCGLVEEQYTQPIDYFDLRTKKGHFDPIDVHLLYDEQDVIVPFEKSAEMIQAIPNAHFVHTKGLGHYKIIAHDETVAYVIRKLTKQETLEVASVR